MSKKDNDQVIQDEADAEVRYKAALKVAADALQSIVDRDASEAKRVAAKKAHDAFWAAEDARIAASVQPTAVEAEKTFLQKFFARMNNI